MLTDSFAVHNLPNVSSQLVGTLNGQYAGLLPASNASDYFFWYFPAETQSDASNNLVIWLNGGPGASSMEGSWIENGPILFQDDGTLTANPFSWHKQANILYVDQPVGTGFSFDTLTTHDTYGQAGVATYFYTFLDNFMNVFPELKTNDLYITGESYAGMYIPYIANGMLQTKTWSDGSKINLQGIALGNPSSTTIMSPPNPSAAVNDYDYFHDAGFFTFPNASTLQPQAAALADQCRNATLEQAARLPAGCFLMGFLMESYSTLLGASTPTCPATFSPYKIDALIPCHASDQYWMRENAVQTYLNLPAVQQAIHVADKVPAGFSWTEQARLMHFDDSQDESSFLLFERIVAAGVKVLVYDGVLDSAINYVSLERLLGNTTWGGVEGFVGASKEWMVGAGLGGKIWSERGLTYIRVENAGHLVAADAPASGFAVLGELLRQDHAVAVASSAGVSSSPVLGSVVSSVSQGQGTAGYYPAPTAAVAVSAVKTALVSVPGNLYLSTGVKSLAGGFIVVLASLFC
ncbi:hypothetical protein HDU98_007269 [Podochytrium sp. JEL0797]|nr:hypothetical protein HDU98_007269 [Podochytrium sp. JEL0797]